MSRVVKANFLILLVLRDNNSCFLSQESPAGFFIFHLFEVFRFSLSRLFPCFTFLGYFQVSPFSGVLIFHLSWMFSLFIFLRYFIFHLSQVLLCCCTTSPTDLREHLLLPGVFTLHSFPPFGTTCFFFKDSLGAGSPSLKFAGSFTDVRNTNPIHLFVWITQCSSKALRNTISTSSRFWTRFLIAIGIFKRMSCPLGYRSS